MATYAELYDIRNNSTLTNKIAVACVVKAQAIIDLANPSVAQINWAKATLANPAGIAEQLTLYLLAKYKIETTATIIGVADAVLQPLVDAAVDKIISVV